MPEFGSNWNNSGKIVILCVCSALEFLLPEKIKKYISIFLSPKNEILMCEADLTVSNSLIFPWIWYGRRPTDNLSLSSTQAFKSPTVIIKS